MNGTGDHHVKWNKPDSERKTNTSCFFYMCKLDLKKKMDMNINGGPWGGNQWEVGGRKRARGREYDQSILYICMKRSQWNPFTKLQERLKKRGGGGETE
jgi:hypothetical protein